MEYELRKEEEALCALIDRKTQVLVEQKEVSDEFNKLLTNKGGDDEKQDGAIENSRKLMKNLEVAIVTAKRPGYFTYHEPSTKVKEIESRSLFKSLTTKIASHENDLEKINQAIEAIYATRKRRLQEKPIEDYTGGFQGWFAQYGKPEKDSSKAKGMMSEFCKSPKIYGGTKHHQAFTSLAVTLKKGRCTR